jgi:ketosteroid isomerase-like protein
MHVDRFVCTVQLVDHVQLVRDTWDALSRGDLSPLETVLAPDAKWRAVEDGAGGCENRGQIIHVMTENLGGRLSGHIDDAFEVGDRVVVAFRPDYEQDEWEWPLDNGIRYVVVSVDGDRITEMKSCATRQVALDYAEPSSGQ